MEKVCWWAPCECRVSSSRPVLRVLAIRTGRIQIDRKNFPPNKLLFSTFRNVLNFIIRLCGPTVKVPIHSCVRCVFISLSFQLGRDTQIKNKKPFGRKNNISIPSSSSSDSRSCPVVHSEDLKKVFFFFFYSFL
jgi:hypothetical protein